LPPPRYFHGDCPDAADTPALFSPFTPFIVTLSDDDEAIAAAEDITPLMLRRFARAILLLPEMPIP